MSAARILWVSGGSSGIGAAFLAAAPPRFERVINISRRGIPGGEHLAADLADPASWEAVRRSFESNLEAPVEEALFFHCAGSALAGSVVDAPVGDYASAALLNAVSGQVLGRAFLAAVAARGTKATLVTCSSPAAQVPHIGLSQYCAGKAALEMWTRVAALEAGDLAGAPRIFAVSPRAVDTPLLRRTMDLSAEELPLAERFRAAASSGGLVTPELAASAIWSAIEDGVPQGAVVPIGAVDDAEGGN